MIMINSMRYTDQYLGSAKSKLQNFRQGDDKKPVLPVKSTQSSPAAKTANSQQTPNKNYKNLLQEFCQKNSHPAPKYQAKDVGDQHSHVFVICYFI